MRKYVALVLLGLFVFPSYSFAESSVAPRECYLYDASGNPLSSTAGALNTTGGGGSGTADSTAANQTTEIARLTSILSALGSAPAQDRTAAGSPAAVRLSNGSAFIDPTQVTATQAGAATAALSQVASSITSVSVLASNANRKYFVLVNDSTSICYVAFGASASSTAYSLRLPANGSYTSDVPAYTGAVSAIWVSANGGLKVTEVTP
jgi:hypothetical protein